MFNSNVLEVGVGVIFTFFAISLITGAIIEAITSMVGWRANTLKNGIKALLNDPDFNGLARDLYAHAAVNPRGSGTPAAQTEPTLWTRMLGLLTSKPGYIDQKQFANALMDITGISSAIANNTPPVPAIPAPNRQISELLRGIIDRTRGDPVKIKAELESWFDNTMDRLSGVYKRWMQFLSFVVALALAVVLNIDSITIAKVLWEEPTLTANLKAPTNFTNPAEQSAAAREALKTLDSYLPVGWPNGFFTRPASDENWTWRGASLGWLITAIATLFGAPFWFDTLQRVARLKGAGPSPHEKTARTAAAE